MEGTIEISKAEFEGFKQVIETGHDLAEALCRSYDVLVSGSDFEFEFAAFVRALDHSPEHCKEGRYIWKAIEEDWKQDAPGG